MPAISMRCTLSGSPAARGRYFQTSSAVNTMMGATMVARVRATCQVTVCALRRRGEAAASQYRRSLVTSMNSADRSTAHRSTTSLSTVWNV